MSSERERGVIIAAVITGAAAIIAALITVYVHTSSTGSVTDSRPSAVEGGRTAGSSEGGASASVDTGGGSPSSPAVFRSGTVRMVLRNSIQLATSATNWAAVPDGCGDCDLWLYSDLQAGSGSAISKLDSTQNADYATCSTATSYQQAISPQEVKAGLQFCVKTNRGNFAGVKVSQASISASGEIASVTLGIVVWAS